MKIQRRKSYICCTILHVVNVFGLIQRERKFVEDKIESYKHINTRACKDKNKIEQFLNIMNFTVIGYCSNCKKWHESKYQKHVNEIAIGDKDCPICNTELRY